MDSLDSLDSGSCVTGEKTPVGGSFAGYATYFWNLYRKNKHTDVVFDLTAQEGPVTFSAHKIVLSIWSPYLADMFYKRDSQTEAAVNIVKLEDVSPETFEDMIRFMYCQSLGDLNHRKACNLYKLAVKFQVQRLVTLCLEYLDSVMLDALNVFDILEVSKDMRNVILVDKCHKLLQEHTKKVMEWCHISAISPWMFQTLLEMPKMNLSGEFELLMWILLWAENRCPEYSDGCIRREVEEFLPYIQLLSLSNEEFATVCHLQSDLFTKDEALSIFMNIGVPGSVLLPPWYDADRPKREFTKDITENSRRALMDMQWDFFSH